MNIELKIINSSVFFTDKEWDIIEHRLGVPCAIVENMTDHHPDDEPSQFTEGEIRDVIDLMLALQTRLHDRENLSDCFKAVLINCCDSSTYFGMCDGAVSSGEMTKAQFHGLMRVANSLERKVEQLTGEPVCIPRF